MKIATLEINDFRNINQVQLAPGPRINVFYGHNGSGKTSLLEAIHYLGLGRSFRTRNIRRLITEGSTKFRIIGNLHYENCTYLPVGIERTTENSKIRIAGKPVTTLLELAKLLPIQLINADSHLLLTSGSLPRRQFLDWGTFHVEPQFFHYWQKANRIIKQRNASLKMVRHYPEISFWDEQFELCATRLHEYRYKYFSEFIPAFGKLLSDLLGRNDLRLNYHPGWNLQTPLKELLKESFPNDQLRGFTQIGPQRADLQLKIGAVSAVELLSQGQQKLAAYALRLAQGYLLEHHYNKNCIFLIDDLPSELDRERRRRVAEILVSLNSQVFVTGIEVHTLGDLIQNNQTKLFHVEPGSIRMQTLF